MGECLALLEFIEGYSFLRRVMCRLESSRRPGGRGWMDTDHTLGLGKLFLILVKYSRRTKETPCAGTTIVALLVIN